MLVRITLALVGMALLFGGLTLSPAEAAPGVTLLGIDHDGGAPDINAGPIVANVGDFVTVSLIVDVEDGEALGAWTVDVRYSATVLDAVSCTAHPPGVCNQDFTPIDARITGADAAGFSGVFNLMDVTFEVVGPAGYCNEVRAFEDTLLDPSGVDLTFSTLRIGGEICVAGMVGRTGIDHDGGAADINAGPAEVAAGDDVAVSLVTEIPALGLQVWTIDVEYDPSVVDAVGCVTHPSGFCNENFSATQVRSVGADISTLTGTQALSQVTFRGVGPSGSCSDLTITVSIYGRLDGVGEVALISFNTELLTGRICVTDACADVTGDGRVTLRDVLAMALRILFRRYDPAFDLNGDGRLDRADLRIVVSQLGRMC